MPNANTQEIAAEKSPVPRCITQLGWSDQARRSHTGPDVLLEIVQMFTPCGWNIKPLDSCKILHFMLICVYIQKQQVNLGLCLWESFIPDVVLSSKSWNLYVPVWNLYCNNHRLQKPNRYPVYQMNEKYMVMAMKRKIKTKTKQANEKNKHIDYSFTCSEALCSTVSL